MNSQKLAVDEVTRSALSGRLGQKCSKFARLGFGKFVRLHAGGHERFGNDNEPNKVFAPIRWGHGVDFESLCSDGTGRELNLTHRTLDASLQ
jgi:hypothetical protein